MRELIKNESGSALAMTLIVMLVLSILGTVMLNMSLAENKFANHNEDKIQAYYIARSGAQSIAEYMVQDNNDDATDIVGYSSSSNNQIGGGEFTIDVQEDPTDSDIVNIVSTGIYNGTTQTVKINLTKTSEGIGGIFDHAIVAKNNVSVASNGNKVDIQGTIASIDGTVVLDKGSALGIEEGTPLVLPDVVIPDDEDIDDDLGLIDVTLNLPITSNSSKEYVYYSNGINIQNENLTVVEEDAVVHLFVEGDINIDTNSALTAVESAKLYVYVKGSYTIEFKGNISNNNVYIYAPESDITWNNAGGSFFGGLVGNNVAIANQATITHNPDMANDFYPDMSNEGINFTGYRWID